MLGGLAVAWLTYLGTTTATYAYLNSATWNVNAPLVELGTTVTITCPTLNEGDYVATALASIRENNIVQAYPEKFEVMLVDSYSEDNTVEMAAPYVDKTIFAPVGLLTARDMAVKASVGDIIININADGYYPPNYINTLLKPYSDPNVVAVGGAGVHPGLIGGTLHMWFDILHPKPWLMGSVSSFRKWAYEAIGGFDLSIDQHDYIQVIQAEEERFAQRLSTVGEVVYEGRALAIVSARRTSGVEMKGSFARFPQATP